MTESDTITVNDIELHEGQALWRLAALRLYNNTFTEQEPDEVLMETAEALANNHAEAVDHCSASEVKANLEDAPGYYDDTDLMRYQAMEVVEVSQSHGITEVVIKDWKEGRRFCFRDPPDDAYPERMKYVTFESLAALEAHLGTTLLTTDAE